MEGYVMQELAGWGRVPRVRCAVFRPERRSGVRAILSSGGRSSYIARGLGRSYGDSAVNADAGVITFERLNRFLGFNPENGELHCEAGVSLGEILDVFLPRGFTLGVTPGTRHVTVGGAIAADVHGKNHHKAGTFSQYLEELTLLTASGDVLTCSSEKESDAFWATVGGMGLSGVILTAKLRLLPVETSFLKVDYKRVANLDEALAALKAGEERMPYVVAWIDCLAQGASLGRSVVMCGRHALRNELPDRLKEQPLRRPRPPQFGLPCDFPGFALNSLSVKAFNALYYSSHPTAEGKLTDFSSFFYPLDGVRDWNRMYGKRGFVQYQAAFPPETSAAGLRELLENVSASGRASFLAVLKGCGDENAAPLSFPMKGHTLALDIPRAPGLESLLGELDLIVLKHKGRLYLAKDSALNAATLERMYPRLEQFRTIVKRLDPRGLFSSDQARRVGLKASAVRTAIGGIAP
jgi:FAD/FMN-containing dehydrogenase